MSYGHQRPGRRPPSPQQVPFTSSWTPSPEGYSFGASPSLDLSNTAGVNGASSYHGHGSNTSASRYLHPDEDGQVPR
jgi:hypothetical protein